LSQAQKLPLLRNSQCAQELGQTNNKNRPKSKSKYITLKTLFELLTINASRVTFGLSTMQAIEDLQMMKPITLFMAKQKQST
jgi:hypothetical protein